MKINTVTVIGANGSMGLQVSGIFASFGNAKVYMVCRTMDKAIEAAECAIKSVRADAIKDNLIPADYSHLEKCIKESDLIFESVAEDFETKVFVNQIIEKHADKNTIIASGTSGLSINKLSGSFHADLRKNYLGLHFYNPPYNMTLCEVIPSVHTDKKLLSDIKVYLRKIIFRTVVEVKDSPAFLGNRIGFQFINEALQYAEIYKDNGGIDYIDSILGQFTGRSMPPLRTSDFVGLDVHKAIVDNVFENTGDYARDTFILPDFAKNLINDGKLGRKSGGGLYKSITNEKGVKKVYVYDIVTKDYREVIHYTFPFVISMVNELRNGDYEKAFEILKNNHSPEAEICLSFLIKYVLYAMSIADEIGDGIGAADDVMATGFNWVPPLAVIDALGGKMEFLSLVNNRINREIRKCIDINGLFHDIPDKSIYDYRRYFKARW